jgi:hypothetical protein
MIKEKNEASRQIEKIDSKFGIDSNQFCSFLTVYKGRWTADIRSIGTDSFLIQALFNFLFRQLFP